MWSLKRAMRGNHRGAMTPPQAGAVRDVRLIRVAKSRPIRYRARELWRQFRQAGSGQSDQRDVFVAEIGHRQFPKIERTYCACDWSFRVFSPRLRPRRFPPVAAVVAHAVQEWVACSGLGLRCDGGLTAPMAATTMIKLNKRSDPARTSTFSTAITGVCQYCRAENLTSREAAPQMKQGKVKVKAEEPRLWPGPLFLAVDALAPFVALLRFDRQRRDRARVEPLEADRLAGVLAVAVAAILDPAKCRVDLAISLRWRSRVLSSVARSVSDVARSARSACCVESSCRIASVSRVWRRISSFHSSRRLRK